MPGKKDPEYYPLNVNLYDFDTSASYHVGKYESLEDGDEDNMSTDDEMRTVDILRSRSGSNTSRPRRIRNVSLNMTSNSDGEEGEGSMQSSSDLDLDGEEEERMDSMDTLVLSIRDKLRVDPFSSGFWAATADSTPPATPYEYEGSNSSSQSSHSYIRRRRINYGSPGSLKTKNPLGSIQKKSSTKHFWSRRGKGGSPRERPYELLQDLLESGCLIKEAVRRLSNTKRLGSSTGAMPIPSTSSNAPTLLSSPTSRFMVPTSDESSLPLSTQ